MATVSIGLRVDPDMKAALERAAHNDHRSVSQLIKKILIEWLEENTAQQHRGRPVRQAGGTEAGMNLPDDAYDRLVALMAEGVELAAGGDLAAPQARPP